MIGANDNRPTKWAYYNEFDPYAAQWLRNLIAAGQIADGEVDERSIADVHADDLKGFTQCHFFAGIGGWSLAARLAGWPDDRPLWTGSAPCQPFSVAGKQEGQSDERHLWPKFFELISSCRPATIMGEQVSAAIRFGWLDGVSADLESEGYTTGAVIIPACAVNAPHRRDRLWFVADADSPGRREQGWSITMGQELMAVERSSHSSFFGNSEHYGQHATAFSGCNAPTIHHHSQRQDCTFELKGASSSGNVSDITLADADRNRCQAGSAASTTTGHGNTTDAASGAVRSFWHGAEYITGPDGKARRIEPSIRLLAHGVPARVGKLRAYGNAIVPQVAAEIIKSYMETAPHHPEEIENAA